MRADRETSSRNPTFCLWEGWSSSKGLQVLIKMWDKVADADLLVAGIGTYQDKLRAMAAGNPRIIFLGQRSSEELASLYEHSMACLVPSIYYETGPFTVIESFARKAPVIAHDMAGMRELVRYSGGGILYKTDEELLAAISRVTASPSLRKELGEKGYRMFEQRWSQAAHLEIVLGLPARDCCAEVRFRSLGGGARERSRELAMLESSSGHTERTPHREDVSTLARGSSVAFVGGLLASMAGWIAQLLLARLLGPGGFGTYSIGMAAVRISSQISTLGLTSAAIYFVARYSKDEPARVRDVLTQSLGASLVAGALVGSVLFLLAPSIADNFFHRPELVSVLRIFACTIGFASSFRVARAATTVSYRLNYRVYLDLLTSGVFLLGFVVFYYLGFRVGGAAVAFLLSSAVGFAPARIR